MLNNTIYAVINEEGGQSSQVTTFITFYVFGDGCNLSYQ